MTRRPGERAAAVRVALTFALAATLAVAGTACAAPQARPPAAGAAGPAAAPAGVARDLPAPTRDPERVRRAVREVLSRPEFRPPPKPLAQRVLEWLLERVGRLLSALTSSGAGALVGSGLLALALVAILLFALRLSRGVGRDPELAAARPAAARRPAADWRAEAETHERAGDWRQALRCRYRALIADLAARGLVDEIPGRTAGEYLLVVGRSVPAAAADFAGATDLFEAAWYGNRRTGPQEAGRFRMLAGRVLERAS